MSGDPLDDVFSLTGGAKPPKPEPSYPGSRPLRQLDEPKKTEALPIDEEWDTAPVMKTLNGVWTEFFRIGHLAAALGRTPVTIRSWEDKGWLPLSQYRTPPPQREMLPDKESKGKRLYTRRQVEIIIAAAHEYNVLANNARNADWKGFTRSVIAGWKSLS